MDSQRDFDVTTINRALTGTRFHRHLQHFPTVDSTNTLLLAAAAQAPPKAPSSSPPSRPPAAAAAGTTGTPPPARLVNL